MTLLCAQEGVRDSGWRGCAVCGLPKNLRTLVREGGE